MFNAAHMLPPRLCRTHRWLRSVPGLLLAVTICAIGGCTNANIALSDLSVPVDQRTHNHTQAALAAKIVPAQAQGAGAVAVAPDAAPERKRDLRDDGVFVGIAVSGGGSRSANFSAAIFLQLERLGLLQRADYISSVSGGSMTAAFYCVQPDDQWTPKIIQQRLSYSFARDLWIQSLLPWNLICMALSDLDRTDLLAGDFSRVLFSRNGKTLTFGDLRLDRPRLIINATDLQTGKKFIFSNEAFDELNSDLSKYPLGYAVAASSAVPVAMHQVTLRDYSTVWPQYRHLIDGGIVDNLGVQSLVETFAAHVKSAKEANQPDPYPRGAVLIIIDARTTFDVKISDKGDTGLIEGIVAGTSLTSTALLNRASSATLADIIVRYSADEITAKGLREAIDQLEKTGTLTIKGQNNKTVRVVHLALSHLDEVNELPFRGFAESVNNIATYYSIEPGEAFSLYQAADLLMKGRFEKEMKQIVDVLDHPDATPVSGEAHKEN